VKSQRNALARNLSNAASDGCCLTGSGAHCGRRRWEDRRVRDWQRTTEEGYVNSGKVDSGTITSVQEEQQGKTRGTYSAENNKRVGSVQGELKQPSATSSHLPVIVRGRMVM